MVQYITPDGTLSKAERRNQHQARGVTIIRAIFKGWCVEQASELA